MDGLIEGYGGPFRARPEVARPAARSSPRRSFGAIVVPAVAAMVLGVVPTQAAWASRVRPARTRFGNGDWVVGKQIAPGTYWTQGATSLPPNATYIFDLVCYWERDKDIKGGPALGSDIVAGQDIVTVLPSDGRFISQNCGTWAPLPRRARTMTRLGDGVYAVGVDLSPGRYVTAGSNGVVSEDGGSKCHWAVLRDFTGSPRSVVASGYPPGAATVTIKPTDAGFETQGCKDWVKSG